MKPGIPYRITKGNDSLIVGDVVKLLDDGRILLLSWKDPNEPGPNEPGGWLPADNVEAALDGVLYVAESEMIEQEIQELKNRLVVLEGAK